MIKPSWAVMISGRGSNLAALLELRAEIDIRLVVSSSANAYGLLRARRASVPTVLTPLVGGAGTDRKTIDWPELVRVLKSAAVTHVFLAGFMKIVPPEFIKSFQPGRVLNLHPSLLPSYPGLNSIARAYHDGASIGVSIHEVDEGVDTGKIIVQRRTLTSEELSLYSLAQAEFLTHVDEQKLVKETLRRWPPVSL